MSTMGTALWSTNLTVMAAFAALVRLSKYEGSSGPRRAVAIGALLGFACWCRPTAIVPAGLVMLWACGRALRIPSGARRRAMTDAAALSAATAISVLLLVLLSRLAYATWLPDYYIGMRLAASDRFGTALVAHLVSPSRGLLLFAPVVVPALGVGLVSPRRVLHAPLAGLSLVWIGLHLAIVSRFPYWWGGYSYGCRLLVEMLPAVFVLVCAAAAAVRGSARHWRLAAAVALAAAGAAGIWINSVQGLFNPATAAWNASPSIDTFPGYAFDWHLPQFLATQARLDDRLERHDRWLRAPLEADVDYTTESMRVAFIDWSDVGHVDGWAVRRSIGPAASIRFLVGEGMVRQAEWMMLTLGVSAERPVAGQVWFNGHRLADLTIRDRGPEFFVIAIPRALVRTIEYNVLESNTVEWRGTPTPQDVPVLLWALRVHSAAVDRH